MKLYKYTGTISEVSFRNSTACDIKLYDMNDRDKAPIRLEVVGALNRIKSMGYNEREKKL